MIKSILPFFFLALFMACSSINKEITAHREKYKQDFLHDPRSPLKEEQDLVYLDFYAPNSKAKIKADFTLTPDAEPFEMPTYSGITRTYRQWGIATFEWQGQKARLAVYENMTLRSNPIYKDYLFLPFKDATNSGTTYGGGRYLNMSKADTEDGFMTIDFNKCYNPWCAYSDGYNCPIPPSGNHLPFAIDAGERQYKGEMKKAAE